MKSPSWSPYLVGVGMGVLSWLVFFVVNKPLGMSPEVAKISGWLAGLFTGMEAVKENAYWADNVPKFGYSTIFLLMTAVGAFLSAKLSGTFALETVPSVWRETRGPGVAKRMVAAFLGGAILLYGARMAGGCTSGHGISGTLQLAVSSWIFFAAMFVTGIVTARILLPSRSSSV
jgi:uncharacterized membrane protein YedE/YeeE